MVTRRFSINRIIFQADLDRYRKVTPAEVQKAAQNYLTDKRLIFTVLPRKGDAKSVAMSDANKPTTGSADKKKDEMVAKTEAKKDDSDWRNTQPKGGPDPKFALPSIEKTKLKNGLDVWLVKQDELPIVSMNLIVKTGSTAEPLNMSGLASVTSGLIDSGTKKRSAVDIANELQSIGAFLNTGSSNDSSNISGFKL